MNNETKTILTKTAKVAGATCVAAGAVALVASGAALKAVTEGAKYLKDVAHKIMDEDSVQKEPVVDAEPPAEEVGAEACEAAIEESAEVPTEGPASEETNE